SARCDDKQLNTPLASLSLPPMIPDQLLFEAIARKLCIVATYNRVEMKLAPHILYRRNDALYIDAVALEKAGAPARELKLGAFHLAGLSGIALVDQPFEADALFDPADSKYAGSTLFAVE
ncbi:MAG: hypothetical protein ACKVOJ_09605, partial [Sphingomonadaceae bacterium]